VATLATLCADGSILLAPVWHEWRDGGFNVIVGADDVKARNIQRDPRVSLSVYEDDPPYAGVELRGQATVASADDDSLIRRLAIRYLGEQAGNAYATSSTDPQVVVRLEPGTLRSWDYSDMWES
jgi:PPOX class probable F420-dependent enzyme